MLAVSSSKVRDWTKDARKSEQEHLRAAVIDEWLNCDGSNRDISERHGVDHKTVGTWAGEYCQVWQNSPPESRQHFDVWQFATADKDSGQQSYFGAVPPQVMENLLWFYTDPGQTVVDLFAGSGTTVDVTKAMGRVFWSTPSAVPMARVDIPADRIDTISYTSTVPATVTWPSTRSHTRHLPDAGGRIFATRVPSCQSRYAGRHGPGSRSPTAMCTVATSRPGYVAVTHPWCSRAAITAPPARRPCG